MSSNFNNMLNAAKAQPEPQRLLFMLALSERTNKAKKSRAQGTITPVMCVDKIPDELSDITAFIEEADSINSQWDMIFIAGMNGENGQPPSPEEAEPLLNKMVNDLVSGQDLSRYLILNREDDMVEIAAN
ncbi:ribonucleotide reductase subunit alpha [Aliikangiella sp. IMCC44359]|uniref:ribonucleotide reductase subunit alpha n=1 Tax=Aliikangiella sp. IMCC44359 TaxID=3459125 RepID=UPI00403A834A